MDIFIIGARGYQANYGGWETFVTNLVDYYDNKKDRLYVSELSDSKDNDKRVVNVRENIYREYIYVKEMGSPKMFIYAMKAYLYTLKYIKENNIRNARILVLGLKLGPLLAFYKRFRKKYNISVIVNPDGLEHKRDKWNKIIKFCFLLSEWSMVRNADLVVCDAIGIEDYIKNKYKSVKTKYIAYGAKKWDLSEVNVDSILNKYKCKKHNYFLVIGRCVPENNYELIIREFMKSKTKKKLIIITNLSYGTYYEELVMKTGCLEDKRIIFIDGVYDKEALAVIRNNAYAYIHGHSVGGTNPSLIEAISLTDVNILYDVCFNRDIGRDACFYFKNEGDLVKIIDDEKLIESSREKFGKEVRKIYNNNFTWEHIVSKYKKVFRG